MIDWFTNLANQFFALNCIFSQPMRNSYFVNVTEEVINAVEDAASQNVPLVSTANKSITEFESNWATILKQLFAFGELLIIIHKLKLVDEKLNDSC